jgi:hypothetical protein
MDTRYHSLTYRFRQKKLYVYWITGCDNIGDYHTIHNLSQHHKYMLGLILHQDNILQVMLGCVKLLPLPLPHLITCTYAHTYQSTQRVTQLTGVLARAYSVSIQNLNTVSTTTVP